MTGTVTPLKYKIALVLSGVLLALVVIELLLRAGGLVLAYQEERRDRRLLEQRGTPRMLTYEQERRNLRALEQSGTARILCLGESTTAPEGGDYPRLLEEELARRDTGLRFSVLNLGAPGANSDEILARLPRQLEMYEPRVVVAMMGASDSGDLMHFAPGHMMMDAHWLLELRVLRLAKLLHLRLFGDSAAPGRPPEQKVDLEQFQALKQEARQLEAAGRGSEAEAAYRRALALDPHAIGVVAPLSLLLMSGGRHADAEAVVRQAMRQGFEQDDRLHALLGLIAKAAGDQHAAQQHRSRAESLRLTRMRLQTIRNFQRLRDLLADHGIPLVAVQYPMRGVAPLSRMLGQDAGVVLVDNEQLFQQAVRRDDYLTYFTDNFGGDFGHCTAAGNHLLARNVAEGVLWAIDSVRSRPSAGHF